MTDVFLDALNDGINFAYGLRRVTFQPEVSDVAAGWLTKKHANGAIHEPSTIAGFIAASYMDKEIDRIWDVGALYGYFSLVARGLFSTAEIAAIEGHPGSCAELVKNVRKDNITVVNAVISDEMKTPEKFWISGFNFYEEPEKGWNDLENQPGAMKPRGMNNRGRGFAKVPFVTLDYIAENIGFPDLIKIDVEAYQGKAVAGMPNIIRTSRPYVIIELHDPEKIARMGTTNAATVQPLFDAGYSAYWCGDIRADRSTFERVNAMEERHEKLSIMVFAP